MMKTSDLWFSAHLRINDYKIVDFKYEGRRGYFFFDITEEDYRKERLNFFDSELSTAKQKIEELKDLMH